MQREVSGRSLLGENDADACDRGYPNRNLTPISKKHARAPETQAWTLEPHVCRHCFGRLVSRCAADAGGDRDKTRYLCTNCGAEAVGDAPDVLCSCGTTLRRHGSAAAPMNAGLRCQPNPAPTPEFPSLFVAAEVRT